MSRLLDGLSPRHPDKIIALMGQYAADPRTDKVDLGLGVYRTADGQTPVMAAIKGAEARLLQEQDSKGYLPMEGDAAFHRALGALVLGQDAPWDRIAPLATPGGTGAIRQALELAKRANPGVTVWIPAETWPNHPGIADALQVQARTYRYYDAAANAVDRDGLFADLGGIAAGDVVILHACCHNPTGADLTLADWAALTDLMAATGAVPMVDVAYQGFGHGLEEDMEGLRRMCAALPEVMITISGSKTFGMYRDRVGLLLMLCADATARGIAAGNLTNLNRLNYGFPPDHGMRAVTMVLTDPALRQQWEAELTAMRTRLDDMRQALAEALRSQMGSDRFGFLVDQTGMFSLLGLTTAQATALREAHGIYVVGDGRVNFAGLNAARVPVVARAIAQVLA